MKKDDFPQQYPDVDEYELILNRIEEKLNIKSELIPLIISSLDLNTFLQYRLMGRLLSSILLILTIPIHGLAKLDYGYSVLPESVSKKLLAEIGLPHGVFQSYRYQHPCSGGIDTIISYYRPIEINADTFSEDPLIIKNTVIPYPIEIDSADFFGQVFFQNVVFKRRVSFEYSHAWSYFSIDNCVFEERLQFINFGVSYHDFEITNTSFTELHFSEVMFKGNANFAGLDIKSDTYFSDVHFNYVKFTDITWNAPRFETSTFKNEVAFINTRSSLPIYFDNTDFTLTPVFLIDSFKQQINFKSSSFKSEIKLGRSFSACLMSFNETTFHKSVRAKGVHFSNHLDFNSSTFQDDVYLVGCHFENGISFKDAIFSDTCDFRNASFSGHVNFNGARFLNYLTFNSAEFRNRVFFYGTILPNMFRFGNVFSIEEIDLRFVAQDSSKPNPSIYLYGTDLDRVNLNCSHFKLIYDDLTPGQRMNFLITLKEKQLQNGFMDSHKQLDIEYHQLKYKDEDKWLLNFIQKTWWNYGHNPEYIWYWIFSLVGVFSLINMLFYKHLCSNVYAIQFILPQKGLNIFRPIIYTCVLFFGLKIKIEELKSITLGTYYLFLVYISGLLCIAFLIKYVVQ